MKLAAYRQIAPTMNAEMKTLFEKFGFDTRSLRASIDENVGIVKLSIELGDKNHKASDGSSQTPDASFYLEHVKILGELTKLKAEWLNETFSMGGRTYKLIGMKRKGKKNLLIERDDGKVYVMDEEAIVLHFSAKAKVKAA